MKIDILVPVYNEENNISRLLEVLDAQNFHDFRIVIVNDGSTDNTLTILNTLKSNYKNLKIIDQYNQGVAKSRDTLLQAVEADYFTFLDADDEIPENYLSNLYAQAVEYPDRTVFCEYEMKFPEKIKRRTYTGDFLLDKLSVIEQLCLSNISDSSWGKLYPSNRIARAWFSEHHRMPAGDDLCTVHLLMAESVFCNSTRYSYVLDYSGMASRYHGLGPIKGAKRRLNMTTSNSTPRAAARAQLFWLYLVAWEQAKKENIKNRNKKMLFAQVLKYLPLFLISKYDYRSKIGGVYRFIKNILL